MIEGRYRYPYTYAADYLRIKMWEICGMQLSRADSSRIRHIIGEVLGMDDEDLAEKLANKYLLDNEGYRDE